MTPQWKDCYEAGDLYRVHGAERTGTYGRICKDLRKKVSWIIKRTSRKHWKHWTSRTIRKHLKSRTSYAECPSHVTPSWFLERDMQNTQENLRRKRPTKRERQSFYRSQPTVTWYRLTSHRHSGRQSRCTGSYILSVTSELNPWDAYSPGRLDQHLNPFYEKDVEEGILDDEKALELLECLWVKFNNQPAPPKVGITLKESGTYTDFANINTGGITPDGKNGVNNVSYLILDCMDEMKLLQPSSNVQISRKTPQKFLKRACEISRKGWGQPAFYNTEAIVQELLNAGKSLETQGKAERADV